MCGSMNLYRVRFFAELDRPPVSKKRQVAYLSKHILQVRVRSDLTA
ncbi:hypothetical protein HanPSC8_Chr01g0041511 [Helianthus annuus]|nr:hypothetical protein HanPSC8_Chr01g0041511 [Helianthus annuus]